MGRGATVSFRIPDEVADRLDALAESTDRPKSWHLEQALSAYLDVQAWQVAHIRQGMEDVEEGRMASHEAVKAWVASWGTDDERDPPA